MKIFTLFFSILAVGSAAKFKIPDFSRIVKSVEPNWVKHKRTFKLSYHPDDEEDRKRIFQENLELIHAHNSQKGIKFSLNLGPFAHLSQQEFKDMQLCTLCKRKVQDRSPVYAKQSGGKVPASVDWRKKGLVTRVKNQGACGSCYSFSATGSLEGLYAKYHKKLVELSEQDIVDCSGQYGNHGCDGGFMDNCFKYVGDNGIMLSKEYPYTAKVGECKHKHHKSLLKGIGFQDVPSEDEQSLTEAIGTVGPVSVAIQADLSSFQLYHDGIYSDRNCTSAGIDHGVLAVGYGSTDGHDYYIVKNSWGSQWGKDGFILISRYDGNMCGIASAASYPVPQHKIDDL